LSYRRILLALTTLLLALSAVPLFGVNTGFYGIVSYLDNGQSGPPAVFDENQPVFNVRAGVTINAGSTIITRDDNQMELTLYKGDIPVGIIYISANTDIRFMFDPSTGSTSLRVNYGRIRTVFEENIPAEVNLQTVKASLGGSDCGITVLADADGIGNGTFTVFGGTVQVTSLLNGANSESATTWQEIQYRDTDVNPPYYWYEEDLLAWQSSMLFSSPEVPSDIDLVLEYLVWPEEEIETKTRVTRVDVIEEVTTDIVDVTDDAVKTRQKRKFDAGRFWSSLLSFEAGSVMYDGEIALKIISRPGASFASDRFEFGLYLNANLIPSKVFTPGWSLPINNGNNEWSFGTDQGGSAPRIVWDVLMISIKSCVFFVTTIQGIVFFFSWEIIMEFLILSNTRW
jgi:hypothetical protein